MTGKPVAIAPVTVRFIPPNGKANSIAVNGRTYSCAANSYIDVPFLDEGIVSANGWVQVAGSGTTAQRPNPAFPGQLYHDTTLNYVVVFEGSAWRNPASGAAV